MLGTGTALTTLTTLAFAVPCFGTRTTLATFWTGTTLASVTAITAVATLTSVTTFTTLRALTTLGTCRTLLITLGLLDEYTVRELELTSLRIDFEQLDGDLVTFLDASLLDGVETLPVNLRDACVFHWM